MKSIIAQPRNPILASHGPELKRQIRYVQWAIIAVTAADLASLALVLNGQVPLSPSRVWLAILGLATNLLAYILLRRQKLAYALLVMAEGFWVVTTIAVFLTGGLKSPWLMSQLALTVFAGLAGGVPGGAVNAALTLVVDFLVTWLDRAGVIALPSYQAPMIETIMALTINILFTVVVIIVVRQFAIESLHRARSDEKLYRALFDKTNDAVFIIGMDRRYLDANQRAVDLLGYSLEELIGMPVERLIVPEERPNANAKADRVGDKGMLPVYERTVMCKDGSRKTVEVNLALVSDENGQPLHIQSVVRDVSERKRLEQQLRDSLSEMEDIAMSDPLTGTLNRRAIMDYAEAEWHRSKRERRPMCLILVDVDNLKTINDHYGHLSGDQVLQRLVEAVSESKRRYDWTGRWGGDEFLMVLPGANLVEAEEVAGRLRRKIAETDFGIEGLPKDELKVSLGVACFSGRQGDETPLDKLLAQADMALYEAKEGGRDRIAIYRD